jgi:hypothetical protein
MAHVNVYPSRISPTSMGNQLTLESSWRTTSTNLLCLLPMSMIHRRSTDYCYYVVILPTWIFPMPNTGALVTILAADS